MGAIDINGDIERYRDAAERVLAMEHIAAWQPKDDLERVSFYDEAIARFAEAAEGFDWRSPSARTRAYVVLSRANLDDDGLMLFYSLCDYADVPDGKAEQCVAEMLDIADAYDWNPEARSAMYVEAMVRAGDCGSKELIRRASANRTESAGGPSIRTDAMTQSATAGVSALAMLAFAEEGDERAREEAARLYVEALAGATAHMHEDVDENAPTLAVLLTSGGAAPDVEGKREAESAAFKAVRAVAWPRCTQILKRGAASDEDRTWIRCCGYLLSYWLACRLVDDGAYGLALDEVERATDYVEALRMPDGALGDLEEGWPERLALAREYLTRLVAEKAE